MKIRRLPMATLRPFVGELWATRPDAADARVAASSREHILPSGSMHLAIRLDGPPIRLFDDMASTWHAIGHAVAAGARSAYYAKATGAPYRSVGAQLRPAAARALFGAGAAELAGRHVALDAVWGGAASELRERLRSLTGPARQLDLLERFLAARLPRARALHPAVAAALQDFDSDIDVRSTVRRSGYSHRHLAALFVDAVGLTPKRHCRVLRFQRMLKRLHAEPSASMADLSAWAGYSDQAHFSREFRGFAGITAQAYRILSPSERNHVVLPATDRSDRVDSVQDACATAR